MIIPDPGSEFFPSRIRNKEFKYFKPKIVSKLSDPGYSSRIWITDPDPDFLPIPDPEFKKHRIPDPDPQHYLPYSIPTHPEKRKEVQVPEEKKKKTIYVLFQRYRS
jgi:hypothetical protein